MGSRGWIEAGTRGLLGLQHATTERGAPALSRIGLGRGSGEDERGGVESKLYPRASGAVTRFRVFGRDESQFRFQISHRSLIVLIVLFWARAKSQPSQQPSS